MGEVGLGYIKRELARQVWWKRRRSKCSTVSLFQLLPGLSLNLQHVSLIQDAAAPTQHITMGLAPEHRRPRRTTPRAPAGAETDMQYGHQPAMLDEQPRLQHQHGL